MNMKYTGGPEERTGSTTSRDGEGYVIRKAGIMILAAAMLSLLMALPSSAAEKTELNRKSAVIAVGGIVKLKVKGTKENVKWVSTNSEVASVNKKGKVTGRTPGNVTIKAIVGGKKYRCRITVHDAGVLQTGSEDDRETDNMDSDPVKGTDDGIPAALGNNAPGTSIESLGDKIAEYAQKFVGNRYVWGGTSPERGSDASGFCYSIFGRFGIQLMRVADDQYKGPSEAYVKLGYKKGTEVKDKDLMPGDLVFYGDKSCVTHVAIYIGNGKVIHSSTAKEGVIISDIDHKKGRVKNHNMRYWD